MMSFDRKLCDIGWEMTGAQVKREGKKTNVRGKEAFRKKKCQLITGAEGNQQKEKKKKKKITKRRETYGHPPLHSV
jgi:hypothetical protein